jgi:DnaK suppressor protein
MPTHLTQQELAEFDALLDAKLEEAERDLALLTTVLNAERSKEPTDAIVAPRFIMDDQPITREECEQLKSRQVRYIQHLRDAKRRIANGTYGMCRVTGRPISKERLRQVPHAMLSIEARRPIVAAILKNANADQNNG